MFKVSIKSIGIMLKYAKSETIIKLIQLLLEAVLVPLSIYFTQRMIDSVTDYLRNDTDLNALFLWGGLLLFSMLFVSTNGFFNGILYIRLKRKLNDNLTSTVIDKFKRLDFACFEDRDVHDTIHRMSDDPQEKILLLFFTITGIFVITISLIGSALIFMQVGIWYMVGFLLLLIPMIICDFKAADMMNTMFNNQSIDERKMHYLSGLLSNKHSIFELKIFHSTDYILNKWRGITKKVLDERLRTTLRSQKLLLISTTLLKGWSFFIVLGLVYAVTNKSLTIGLFTALISSTGLVLERSNVLSHISQNLRNRFQLVKHYENFLALPEIQSDGECVNTKSPKIIFENVVFSYPKTDKVILDNVNFEINPYERVSIVGENGAGKSTIIKLLLRLYKPDSGRILVDDKDIKELSQSQLQGIFGVVFQDFCTYSLTLRENIAFGDIEKLNNDDALKTAQKQGLADGLNLPLDTNLGKLEEDGIDLSGGQWQRVAIARACVRDSAFVILDEPTSSLDPVAESEMYHSFSEVLKNKGCIMISHRLASAKMADKIIVLSCGKVIECGSHENLIAENRLYAKMYSSQSAWYTSQEGGNGE